MRAVVVIPIEFPGALFDDDDFILDDIENLGNFYKVKPRAEFRDALTLKKGPLATASSSRIPCGPFNKSLGRDLSKVLRRKFEVSNYHDEVLERWTSRSSTDFFEVPLSTSISGVKLEAVEAFTISHYDERERITYLLVFHLVANENETNIEAIIALTKLDNSPVQKFLNHFYYTAFQVIEEGSNSLKLPNLFDQRVRGDYEAPKWNLPRNINSSFCVLSSSNLVEPATIKGGNLILRVDENDRDLTRFATKAAFLAALVNIQKFEFDALEDAWLKYRAPNSEEVTVLRDRLVLVRRNWWWPQISYDEAVQDSYTLWINSLGLEKKLNSFEKDLAEWWSAYTAKKLEIESEELARLNNLLKVIAIFGLVPAWLSLFATTFPWWIALILALSIGYSLWKVPARHMRRVIARFESKLK